MTSKLGFRRTAGRLAVWLLAGSLAAQAGTFGKVISIGGHAADLALDEARGVLYVANFTANRIEVMSLADGSIQTSMNVSAQPAALALSPDGRYLVVGHFGNFAAPSSPTNALTVIDLDSRARQTFALGYPVLGVAFGINGLALVVTTVDFQLFDPVSGRTQVLDTVTGLTAKTLPVANGTNFPPNIVAASVGASGDGKVIYGLSDTFTFRYSLVDNVLEVVSYTSTPAQGPRAVSVNQDGSYFVAGWVLSNARGDTFAQFPNPNGALNIGSHAFDTARGLIYSQVPVGGSLAEQTPQLQIVDADNLRVRERLNLAENLAGKGVLSSGGAVMYAVSDSGVTILPVGSLNGARRVEATQQDLIFRGNFCDRRVATQEIGIVNPGGGAVDFTLSTKTAGITISPLSGTTPATIRVSVDPAAFQNLKGTFAATIDIATSAGVNVTKPIRVLLNNREPDQRGTIVNVPGKLVDVLGDPTRDRFYIIRQDTNEVLVFDGTSYMQIAALRTGNTPTQLAITFDRRNLLVGHDNSQIISVFDLETLEKLAPVFMPGGHYPRSIAASGKAILAANRVAGPTHKIDRIDMVTRIATELPSLGVYANDINSNTFLVASANGSSILAAQPTGQVMLYNANADTFTVSRKDVEALSGAVAASSFDQYVVGNRLMNSSLVLVRSLETGTGKSSGFAFIDKLGFRTTAPDATSSGVIQRVDPDSNSSIERATRMAEAPVLPDATFAFTRTVSPLYSRNVIINLTTSGFTVLPWNYDAAVAPPRIERVTNIADGSSTLATGGLISIVGTNLSPINLASNQLPLPTALGESCLTVNGVPTPILFVSPTQINAQVPFNVEGNVTLVLRTPGGVSDNFNLVVLPGGPGVIRTGMGANDDAAIVRWANGEAVTLSNPVHRGDTLIIMLTGLGKTSPPVESGAPGPSDPPALTLVTPVVTLGGVEMPILFSGLAPGLVGVYQVNALVPGFVPVGLNQPLVISQDGRPSGAVYVRVVD